MSLKIFTKNRKSIKQQPLDIDTNTTNDLLSNALNQILHVLKQINTNIKNINITTTNTNNGKDLDKNINKELDNTTFIPSFDSANISSDKISFSEKTVKKRNLKNVVDKLKNVTTPKTCSKK